jgi:hypothetical protein
MALVYPNATLDPSKRELIDAWLPSRPWYDGQPRKPVGSFRFDDPAGEVGMEGFLVGGEGLATLFVPLTYRAAALDGAEDALVGSTAHSELGTRYVYDGCADPVFVRSLVTAIVTGARGVDHEFDLGDGPQSVPTNAQVQGSGSADTAVPDVELVGSHDEDRGQRGPGRAGRGPRRRHTHRSGGGAAGELERRRGRGHRRRAAGLK